jgi:flagella basal body P-ring formation protein FlgA
MINRYFFRQCFYLVLTLFSISVAAEIQNLDSITKTAKSFLERQLKTESGEVEIRLGTLDPRLRLPACSRPLTGFLPKGTELKGNAIVGIRCVGEQSWHIYLPVELSIKQRVIVFKRHLAKGTVISVDDLDYKMVEVADLRFTPVTDPKRIVGSIVKRRVNSGEMVNPQITCMVCKGEKLFLIAQNANLSVSMEATALEDGHYGDSVKVKNNASSRVIDGTVIAKNKVRVEL